jgi:hypothetical protein
MAKSKRRASGSNDHEQQSKIVKVSQPEDPTLEQTPNKDNFQIEIKVRSASKAERNDPKSPGYWEERNRAFVAAMNREDTLEASASPSFDPFNSGRVNTADDHQVTLA